MPRATENQILESVRQGNPIPAPLLDKILRKVSLNQKKAKGRATTEQTQRDFVSFYSSLNVGEQTTLRLGIMPYVADSSSINNYCRTGQPQASQGSANALSDVFRIYRLHAQDQVYRITYRLQTYRQGQVMPFTTAVPPGPGRIGVGDLITDAGFWSTSENRQLLVNGINNPPAGVRYVKFVIMGQGGINIAAHFNSTQQADRNAGWTMGLSYSNENEAALAAQRRPNESAAAYKMRMMFTEPGSGQAEILFDRDTIFKVEAIQSFMNSNDVHVRLSVPAVGAGAKNSFSGAPVQAAPAPVAAAAPPANAAAPVVAPVPVPGN